MKFMSTTGEVPVRPDRQWPIGVRLRFRPDAAMNDAHQTLRGKPVLVLSELQLIGSAPGRYSWRQQVLSLSTCKTGWARPDQLDLPIDDDTPE